MSRNQATPKKRRTGRPKTAARRIMDAALKEDLELGDFARASMRFTLWRMVEDPEHWRPEHLAQILEATSELISAERAGEEQEGQLVALAAELREWVHSVDDEAA